MNLLIVTETYPYAAAREQSFLDPEMSILADMAIRSELPFEIYIAPLAARGPLMRTLPKPIRVVDWLYKRDKLQSFTVGTAKAIAQALYASTLADSAASEHSLKSRLQQLARWAGAYSRVRYGLAQNIKSGEPWLHYTYWFNPATSACIDFARSRQGDAVITRAHGIDLFDERVFHPRRRADVDGIDFVFPVSACGTRYLQAKYGNARKTSTCYLGIDPFEHTGIAEVERTSRLNVVSCAYLTPVKRIPLLCEGLIALANRQPERDINWDHYGDGPEAVRLRTLLQRRPNNLKIDLKGNVENSEFRTMLRSVSYDCLVNVSESEGLPVSLMEAAEAGIPLVATDVGGSSEIVGKDAGVLLPANPSTSDIVNAILQVSGPRRAEYGAAARRTWDQKFDARKNHRAFYLALRKIMERRTEPSRTMPT